MLINMGGLLRVARKHHFTVGASSICDNLLFLTVMERAEEQHAPVIVELAPPEFSYVGSDSFAYAVEWMQNSSVPCVLHLDHGKTIQDCIRAIRCGLTSVMIDDSLLAYEDNVKLTKIVIELAHGVDVSIEGKIGTIDVLSDSVEGSVEQVTCIKSEEVTDFLTRTNTDTLTVAIGTAHGVYLKGFVPRLRLNILKATKKTNTCSLVLHGDFVNRDEETAGIRRRGICKVNIASDVRKASFQGIKEMLIETDIF